MRKALCCLILAAALAACGSSNRSTESRLRPVTLMLDFTPNAAHAGIYAALAHHYDRDQNINLRVIAPPSPSDSIKLLETGKVNFSILDIHDLAIARERGADLVAVMAIVERPLAALIAQPRFATPRLLQGRTIGVSGDPSDTAVLDSIVGGDGGNVNRLKQIAIGADAVPDLLSGRIAAATAFWSDEGVALPRRRPGFHVFKVDSYGAPSYPELVLCATGPTVRHDPSLAHALIKALERGYQLTIDRPAVAAGDLEQLVPGLDHALIDADLAALRQAFTPPGGSTGELNLAVLRAWSRWEARFGIVSSPPDVARAFDAGLSR